MIRTGRFALAAAAALAVSGLSATAAANAKHESPYSYDQTFGSTLRLLKVDLDLEVKESNAEWGYLVFVYTSTESGDRKHRGSFTFIRDESDQVVHVRLQIPEMPNYHEQHVLGQLKRKLSSEHGEPPARTREPDPPPRDDEDDDDAAERGDSDREAKKDGKEGKAGKDRGSSRRKPRRRPARTSRRKPKS